jgi:hypothetical protein
MNPNSLRTPIKARSFLPLKPSFSIKRTVNRSGGSALSMASKYSGIGSGDKLTDEVEKVLQNRRPSQLGEPFHDKQHYNAFVPEVWQ